MQDVPCVATLGKKIKLPLMGKVLKSYPSYNEILRAQLGDESFSSMSASEGKDAELRESPSEGTSTDWGGTEAPDLLAENMDSPMTDVMAKGLAEPAFSVDPSKKKKMKMKKKKSSKKVTVDAEGQKNLAKTGQVACDRSIDDVGDPKDLTEKDPVESLNVKRKEPSSELSSEPGYKRQKRSHDRSPLSLREIALPVSHLLPWGVSSPPSSSIALASFERWTFCHDKDVSFVNESNACAELVCQIRGNPRLMPATSELAFPDGFNESARADMEVSVQRGSVFHSLWLLI